MTTLNRNQIIALSHNPADLFDFMNADEIYVETSHIHFKGEPRVTLSPVSGNILSVISAEHGEVEICAPSYNNFLPHNLIAIHF